MNVRKPGRLTSLFSLTLTLCLTTPGRRSETVVAKVVALDQAFYNNRLGAFQAGGMIFALRGDVVSNDPVNYPALTAVT